MVTEGNESLSILCQDRNKHNKLYRIVMTRALKWQIQGIPVISFDSYFQARQYRANL